MYPYEYGGALPNRYSFMNGILDNEVYNNVLKVVGRGTIKAKPDIAEIVIGVITENEKLQLAQAENSRLSFQVIEGLNRIGVQPKDIQTERYNINSRYDFSEGKQIFRGYEVSNFLKVTIRDTSKAGLIIDTAVNNGANNIGNINFTFADPSKYYADALRIAVEDAQNKAIIIATKLKVKVDVTPIRIIEQTDLGTTEIKNVTFKAVASTPIEAGQNTINAIIEAMFLYN